MVFATHALQIPLLWTGVDLFFVISGYLITGILLRLKDKHDTTGEYWKPFYLRRIQRIIPPYAAFLVVLTLFFDIPWAHLWYWYAFFGANFALAFNKVSVIPMTPLWSLAVEEQFYFIWPLVVLLCSRETLRRAAFAVIVVSPLLRGVCTHAFTTHFPIYSLTIFRADTLAAGAFIALSETRDAQWIERHRYAALATVAVALLLFAGLSLFPSFRTGANSVLFNAAGYSLSVILFSGILLYALGLRHGFIYKMLTARPVRYLGVISYTFYLYHLAVLTKVDERVHSPAFTALLAFVITLAISAISWHFFESRILQIRKAQSPQRFK